MGNTHTVAIQPEHHHADPKPDRRVRRRRETLQEILDHAVEIMAVNGVAGLSMVQLARAMSIRPPSLYKYFPSLMAIYDALFRQGQQANLEVLADAIRQAPSGLEAVDRGMEATGRWAVEHPVLAQLLFWRPVPGFEPTADAFAPAVEVVHLLRTALIAAADAGEIHPDAASDEGMALLSVLHFGVISQHLANDVHNDWDHGTFTRLHPRLISMFVAAYPPPPPAHGALKDS
jgi:AcrR family transcriptional regulator